YPVGPVDPYPKIKCYLCMSVTSGDGNAASWSLKPLCLYTEVNGTSENPTPRRGSWRPAALERMPRTDRHRDGGALVDADARTGGRRCLWRAVYHPGHRSSRRSVAARNRGRHDRRP